MKFIYGKNDFKTLERGEENCWLLTNGLGGFSSCTGVNSVTRNDHALLMASLKAPNIRWNLVHRVSEKLVVEEEKSDEARENEYLVVHTEFRREGAGRRLPESEPFFV